MSQGKRYTSYCGLFCLDCIPSNAGLFSKVRELDGLLASLRFERYAELKSAQHAVFKEYSKFVEVLREIGKLECAAPCRDGGGKPVCGARDCVLSRGYDGCWECGDYRTCTQLAPLKGIHPNLERHLDLIRREGLENWSVKRGKHYCWE